MKARYKLVVFVPVLHADAVRTAMSSAGAGRLGNGRYSACSFSTRGTGRFKPEADAKPHIGSIGTLESTEEERIEVTVEEDALDAVIAAMKAVHPYEEVAYDIYPLQLR